jgi:hypothetical protein
MLPSLLLLLELLLNDPAAGGHVWRVGPAQRS